MREGLARRPAKARRASGPAVAERRALKSLYTMMPEHEAWHQQPEPMSVYVSVFGLCSAYGSPTACVQ